jgi:hypothetical protein
MTRYELLSNNVYIGMKFKTEINKWKVVKKYGEDSFTIEDEYGIMLTVQSHVILSIFRENGEW